MKTGFVIDSLDNKVAWAPGLQVFVVVKFAQN